MCSNPNPSLQFRSITDIISPYRNSFRDIDFRYLLSSLISREQFLTRDFNLQTMHWERQLRGLRRELSMIKDREDERIRVLELEKDDLFSKLELFKSSSIEWNDRILDLVRVLDEKDEDFCRLVEKLSEMCGQNEEIRVLLGEYDVFVQKVEVLEKEKSEIEVKLKDCLMAGKVKFDEEFRKLRVLYVGIKDEIEGLRRVLGEKNMEICGKNERIEMLTRRVEALEKEKSQNEVKIDETRRENESLVSDVGKFNEQLNKVKMEKSGFEIELIKLRKENEYLIAANKGCDEQLDKLKKERSEIEIKLEKFQRENQRLVAVKVGVDELLKKEKTRGEIKLDEFRRKNECLIAKMAKSGEELKSLRKEMYGKIKEMKEKNDAEIESFGRESEVKILLLKKMMKGLEIEKSEIESKLELFQRENESLVSVKERVVEQLDELEKEKIQNEIKFAKFCRDNEYLKAMKAKSDEEIEVLTRKVEVLEKGKRENEVKFDEILWENEYFIAKMAKSDEELKSLRKMDWMIMEMKKKNDVEIESLGREKEVKIQELNKKIEGLEIEKSEIESKLELFQRENESLVSVRERVVEKLDELEKEKIQNEIKIAKFRRDNEYLKANKAKSDEEMESLRKLSREMDVMIKEMQLKHDAQVESLGREKEVKIEQLKKKMEGLEMEKNEIMKEKEEATREYEKVEKLVAKLEKGVARLFLGNVPNHKLLMNDQIEKVLSCVIDVIDSEGDGGIDRVEKIHKGVNTTSGFVTEVRRETKRRRVLSQCSNQKNHSDDTSNKSLNPSCKVKKAVDLVHQPPFAASGSRSDVKFATPPKEVVAPIKQYKETSIIIKETPSNPMMGGDSSQHSDCSPQVKELIATCRSNKRL